MEHWWFWSLNRWINAVILFCVADPFICVSTRFCGFGDIDPGWWTVTTDFMVWQSDICRSVSWSVLISIEDVSPYSNRTYELSNGSPSPISLITPEFTDINPMAPRCQLSHSFKLLSNCCAWPSKECRTLWSMQVYVFAFPCFKDVFWDAVVSEVSNLCFCSGSPMLQYVKNLVNSNLCWWHPRVQTVQSFLRQRCVPSYVTFAIHGNFCHMNWCVCIMVCRSRSLCDANFLGSSQMCKIYVHYSYLSLDCLIPARHLLRARYRSLLGDSTVLYYCFH